jgi:hypothetical protein
VVSKSVQSFGGGENIPQGLKPLDIEDGFCGTAKAVPFQSWLCFFFKTGLWFQVSAIVRGGENIPPGLKPLDIEDGLRH